MDVFKEFSRNQSIDYLFQYFKIDVCIVLFVDGIAGFCPIPEYFI